MIDLTKSLNYLRPGEEWTLNGDDYEGLVWLSQTKQPTKKELADAYPLAIAQQEAAEAATATARASAIEHAKGLGFTDEMIAVMYPNLGSEA